MSIESHPAYEEERQRLSRTVAEIDAQLAELRQSAPPDLQELMEEESPDAARVAQHSLAGMHLARAWQLRTVRPEPFFGRIDFQEEGAAAPETLYIGKTGIERRRDRQPWVIDWRAPVASLFYNAAPGGEAAYEAPAGTIRGRLHLRRSLAVKGGMLQRIVDSQLTGAPAGEQRVDEFLLYRLWESRDARLRDIVSTIQAEQNRIIRADCDRPLIIQGAAGSGKTTVALHRLAFLLYRHRERMAPGRIWIFAPNQIFLDYISAVLPELGVGGIQQTTFQDWALAELGWEVRLTDPEQRLARLFDPRCGEGPGPSTAASRFKGSLEFRDLLDRALADYEARFVPGEDVELWPGARIRAREIRQWFHEQYAGQPLYSRKERIIARVKVWMGQQLDPYRGRAQFQERHKLARAAVRRWAALWPDHTPLQVYAGILAGQIGQAGLPPELARDSLALLRQGQAAPEDLAALVWLKGRLQGFGDRPELDHVVIDEAQDFSPLQVALLRELARTDSFTILGDLNQGIHAGQGIEAWDELMAVFPGGCRYVTLEQSYRSTCEIMAFASAVLQQAGAPVALARPVFRSGARVQVGPQVPGAVAAAVRDLQARGHASIAVVGRTGADAEALQAELARAGIPARLITARQAHYRGGISAIPSYLTKGLEFDAVIVAGAGAASYRRTARDARLLYVCLTRALHELVVLYPGEPSPLLAGVDPGLYDAWQPCTPGTEAIQSS